jgi:hypothetical protein
VSGGTGSCTESGTTISCSTGSRAGRGLPQQSA